MYHSRFKGTHYDAGFKYGAMLYEHGAILSEKHIMNITHEKMSFGTECEKLCESFYPEIIEEMKGIADGQKMSFEQFSAFIFGIYCFTLDNMCTCFAFRNDEQVVFGRNSDFLVKLEKLYDSCFYRLQNANAFIGNTTAMVQIEDGVNEHGLAAGLTFIYPAMIKPGLNAGLLVRYILEKCSTVKDAIYTLRNLPIASNQTLTLADATGDMAVVECNSETIEIIEPFASSKNSSFVCTANNFNSMSMRMFRNPAVDDWGSDERYGVAYEALSATSNYSIEFAKDLLSGKYGFMCQYERSSGHDTVWSSIYDLKNKSIYRAEGNPMRNKYLQDTRLKFSY